MKTIFLMTALMAGLIAAPSVKQVSLITVDKRENAYEISIGNETLMAKDSDSVNEAINDYLHPHNGPKGEHEKQNSECKRYGTYLKVVTIKNGYKVKISHSLTKWHTYLVDTKTEINELVKIHIKSFQPKE